MDSPFRKLEVDEFREYGSKVRKITNFLLISELKSLCNAKSEPITMSFCSTVFADSLTSISSER